MRHCAECQTAFNTDHPTKRFCTAQCQQRFARKAKWARDKNLTLRGGDLAAREESIRMDLAKLALPNGELPQAIIPQKPAAIVARERLAQELGEESNRVLRDTIYHVPLPGQLVAGVTIREPDPLVCAKCEKTIPGDLDARSDGFCSDECKSAFAQDKP